eukprot:4302080-Amphidinium_carterae.1
MGNLKVKGEYNFSYLKRQDCRKLKKEKVKLRPAGLLAPEARSTGLDGAPAVGGTRWVLFFFSAA